MAANMGLLLQAVKPIKIIGIKIKIYLLNFILNSPY
jgi:hypothetical protein